MIYIQVELKIGESDCLSYLGYRRSLKGAYLAGNTTKKYAVRFSTKADAMLGLKGEKITSPYPESKLYFQEGRKKPEFWKTYKRGEMIV